jgi:D-lactate dehydrogenase (cytochrome)
MPKGLGQSLTAPAAAATRRQTCLALRTVPVRLSSTENNKPKSSGPSFKGQLTHSIMKRLERERADLERMARTRPESTMARNFSMTFGRHLGRLG